MSVYEGHGVTLHHGDCLDVLRSLPDASVDSVVTDPPYGLEFMGKDWDAPWKQGADVHAEARTRRADEMVDESKRRFIASSVNKYAAGLPFQQWCEAWATECLRVLKPGGHLLAFGGTRTWHRLACAVEDAGFEVRDSIAWMYGCLSDDTEILTSEGWVRYDRATEGQHALAFDTATGALAWQAIQHVHRYPYAGEMVRLHSEHTDQLLTPNHRVILDAESRLPYASDVCDLRDAMVEAERMGQADRGALLLSAVQRSAARPGVGEARAQGSGGVDRRQPGVLPGEDDRAEQPRMEGRRYRVQEARELRRSAVRASAGVGAADGPHGRVHHGAPATDGRPLRVPADPAGSHQPREPRPQGQPTGEPDPLALEPSAQALRVGEDGGGRLLPSTGVTADVVDYAGVVWCITVPHGAFIARRNGLIFATGNSGFPKSMDVSKAIDKAAGAEREVTGTRMGDVGIQGGNFANATKRGVIEQRDTPATDAAREWEGWGTALKPSFEGIVCATKPVPALARIGSRLDELEQSCRPPASGAVPSSAPTHPDSLGARTASAPASAATRREDEPARTTPTGAAGGSSAATATSASELTGATFWNTVTSWKACWAELCEATSTSTTGTTSSTTTDLETLWSCLSQITPESTTTDPTSPDGLSSLVGAVDAMFAAAVLNSRATRTLTAIGSATSGTPPTSPAAGGSRAAFEPVVVARKPLAGTVAANVLAHGTGALNIDGCRIGDGDDRTNGGPTGARIDAGEGYGGGWSDAESGRARPSGGRWPANVVLDESQAGALDEQSGERPGFATQNFDGTTAGKAEGWGNIGAIGGERREGFNDTGGASRFFYVAKADATERPRVNGTAHPTVKPLALMRWLVRLVTPPGGTVLEPFAGSGTTVEACIVEGFQCIAIEREADYLPLIRQRIDRRRDPVEALRGQAADLGLFDLLGGEGA